MNGLRDAKHLSDTPDLRSLVAGVANPATIFADGAVTI